MAVILLISLIVNVSLVLGERRVRFISNQYQAMISEVVQTAQSTPVDRFARRPIILKDKAEKGMMILSPKNMAKEFPEFTRKDKQAQRLKKALSDAAVSYEAAYITTGKVLAGKRFRPRKHRPPPPRRNDGPPPMTQGTDEEPEVHSRPPPPDHVKRPRSDLQEIRVSVELAPGVWLNSIAPLNSGEALSRRLLWASLMIFLLGGLAFYLFSRRILGPLKTLQQAAHKLGQGDQIDVLPLKGPTDIRETIHAFNAMQTRLTRLISTQQTMLRAIGHDLRTPITSLRLRAENLSGEQERDKIINGLNTLSKMTDEILGWSRDATSSEDLAIIDLTALLESLTDDYKGSGANVIFGTPDMSCKLSCRRLALRRAVTNLIDNALNYGGDAHISLAVETGVKCIVVKDHGPGIPEDKLQTVTEPFVRLEPSRNQQTGGTGLGLSIARSIAELHGGTLTLSNHSEGGLIAQICLPNDN